jgi:glycosyltransferase involved in cell wall biosynthesis
VRVIQIAPTPFGAAGLFGGGERYPLELSRALAAHVDCTLLTFGPHDALAQDASGLRIRTLRATGWLRNHPAHPFAPGLPAAVRDADVVHTHHMRSLPSRMAALLARARQATTAVTDHGLQGDDWFGLLPRLFHLFLAVSAYSALELRAPVRRTRVIYGGADPVRFAPDPLQPRNGVLFVGRLTPHKGIDRLIRALPEGASATIAGSSGHDTQYPERDYPLLLRRLARDRNVRFAGPVADKELPLLYRSARVLVLPSVQTTVYGREMRVSELLGLAVLEAMASGTPVVASRIGGVSEIVRNGETGYLVPPGDAEALHDRLACLLGDVSLARRLGTNARQDVLDRFTWQRVAARCLDAYAFRTGQPADRPAGR